LLAFVGLDPIDANDWQWAGAYRALELIEDTHYIRMLLENTAKESKKPKPARGGMRRYGRR
jgi:hypothetical protein